MYVQYLEYHRTTQDCRTGDRLPFCPLTLLAGRPNCGRPAPRGGVYGTATNNDIVGSTIYNISLVW